MGITVLGRGLSFVEGIEGTCGCAMRECRTGVTAEAGKNLHPGRTARVGHPRSVSGRDISALKTEASKRDSSTAQADPFAEAKEKDKASACFARNNRCVVWADFCGWEIRTRQR
jgi:hypothetical protein